MRQLRRALLIGVVPLLVACAAQYRGLATPSSPAELESECGALAVAEVPFIAQRGRADCGAAALAMIFAHWQIPASQDDVLAACPPDESAGGIKVTAMRDLARDRGLSAFLIHGELTDLEHELARGRPVLVGLAQPYADETYTHYAVVVGIDRTNDRVMTIDPARGWQKNTIGGFLDEWDPVGRPAVVFFRPTAAAGAHSPVSPF